MTATSPTPRTYVIVFAILIVLSAATVSLSYVELGAWHPLVGLAIAAAKAALIILFFMHILASARSTWLAALAGLFWLGILLSLTMTDYLSRGWDLR